MSYSAKLASEKSTIENTSYFREFVGKINALRTQTLELLGTESGDTILKLQGRNQAFREVIGLWDKLLEDIKKREPEEEEKI